MQIIKKKNSQNVSPYKIANYMYAPWHILLMNNKDLWGPVILLAESRKGPEKVTENPQKICGKSEKKTFGWKPKNAMFESRKT